MLECTTKTFIEVQDYELDRFVNELLGLKPGEIEFVPLHEASNDSDHTFRVEKDNPSEYQLREVREWMERKYTGFFPGYHALLNWLAINGHIEPGEYIIKVSW